MIYLDTCILIYAVEDLTGRGERVRGLLVEREAESFAISGLTKLECLVGPYRTGDNVTQSRYEQVFAQLNLLPTTEEAFVRAARLRAEHGLKTPDALHLSVALGSGCSEFWTNDHRLARVAGQLAVVVGEG